MNTTNITINLSIDADGLSHEIADSITSFFQTHLEAPCLDNEKLIDFLHLKSRPIQVESIQRKGISNQHDSIEINLKG